jgi:dolichol-phosphate mannosyltransferase
VRTKERGLSSAVLHGFNLARGRALLCMDADLQHPPEAVPGLLKSLLSGDSNKGSQTGGKGAGAGASNSIEGNSKKTKNIRFVSGTRYGGGAAVDKDWPLHRKVISAGAVGRARVLLS